MERTPTSRNRDTQIENLRDEEQLKRWERRKEMYFLFEQGYAFSDFADELSKKYGMSTSTLRRDWSRRRKWLLILGKIDDKKFQASKINLRIQAIMSVAWETYRLARKAKNSNAMVGAVEKLIRVSQHQVEIMQSIGVLAKEPDKIDAFVTTAGPMPWEDVPEVKIALDKIREKLAREKAAEQDVEAET